MTWIVQSAPSLSSSHVMLQKRSSIAWDWATVGTRPIQAVTSRHATSAVREWRRIDRGRGGLDCFMFGSPESCRRVRSTLAVLKMNTSGGGPEIDRLA